MALITQTEWENHVGASRVADLTGSVSARITAALDAGTDLLQEYAAMAGTTLTAGTMTNALKRRHAIVSAHFAADAVPEFRDARGDGPYVRAFEGVKKELGEWAARVRSLSTDTLSEGPLVLSDDARGWDDPTATDSESDTL